MKVFVSALVATATIAVAPASAEIIKYRVSSTDVVNCTSSPHGLWTNNFVTGGACSNYFDVDASVSYFELDTVAGTARLYGSAENPQGVTADFDVYLTNFLETINGTSFTYKQEGGPSYDPLTDTPDIDFFSDVDALIDSTIILTGGAQAGTYTIDKSDPFRNNTIFQYGDPTGANAKDDATGGSAWLNVLDDTGNRLDKHWDFNLNFERITVSEPGTLAIFGLGLVALGLGRRRK